MVVGSLEELAMLNKVFFLAIVMFFWPWQILAWSEELPTREFTMEKDAIACVSETVYRRLMSYMRLDDKGAWEKMVLVGYCVLIKKGQAVFIERISGLTDFIQIRQKGNLSKYWTTQPQLPETARYFVQGIRIELMVAQRSWGCPSLSMMGNLLAHDECFELQPGEIVYHMGPLSQRKMFHAEVYNNQRGFFWTFTSTLTEVNPQ